MQECCILPSTLITSSPRQGTQFAHHGRLNPLHVLQVNVQFTWVDTTAAVERPRNLVQVDPDHPHVFEQSRHDQAVIAGQDWPNARSLQIQGPEKAGHRHAGFLGGLLNRRVFLSRDANMHSAILLRRHEKSLEFCLIHSAVGPYWRLRQMIEGSSLDCRKVA